MQGEDFVVESSQDFEEFVVYGYIRSIGDMMTKMIPDSLIILCVDFFGRMDYFFKPGYEIKISQDGLIITKNSNAMNTFNNTTYGTKWIQSDLNDTIYTWKFRIIHGDGIIIGISNNEFYAENRFYATTSVNNIYYAWNNKQKLYTQSRLLPI